MKNLKLALRNDFGKTVVKVENLKIGEGFAVIAGPCSVENEKQTIETALAVKKAGADALRGGAFKPRSSPYAFQGLGLKGLKILQKAKKETGLPIVTEVVDARDVFWMCEYVDVLQIGARNVQNFALLKEVGKTQKPVLLKRGMNLTIEEWLNCAEYILSSGNSGVILCERGIRTHEHYTRFTLDISSIPVIKELSHLPILVDPSHATGKVSLIPSMCMAALAAGADGMLIEVHVNPSEALCDKEQSLTPAQFTSVMSRLRSLQGFLAAPHPRANSVLMAEADKMDLQKIRNRIDRIDSRILALINQRLEWSLKTRCFKHSICEPAREQKVIEHVRSYSKGVLRPAVSEKLFRILMQESKRLQGEKQRLTDFQRKKKGEYR